MTMKLIVIPWLMFGFTVKAQNAAITSNHGQLLDTSLYNFLQRQNQINNAIMLNNALLANSLVTVPSNEHHIRLPNTLHFPATNLHTNPNQPLFHDFPQTMPTVPIAGLNRLGIYDVLSNVRSVDDKNHATVPAQAQKNERTTFSSADHTSVHPLNRHMIDSEKSAVVPILDEDLTEVIYTSSPLPVDDTNTSVTPIAGLKAKVEGDTFVSYHKKTKDERAIQKPNNIYMLLKTLNLTDEETSNIISHVEKVVREELAKKLSEMRLTWDTKPSDVSRELSSVVSSTNATIQAVTIEAEKKIDNQNMIQVGRSTSEKELLLLLPRKNGESEIKHHPQRITDKAAENRSNFVEAEILTAQLHVPIEEKMADERNYDDLLLSNEDRMTLEVNEHPKGHKHETSSSTTTTKPSATARQQSSTPPQSLPIVHIREVISNTKNSTKQIITTKSYAGIDAQSFATGAPLDLDNEDGRAASYRNRNLHRSSSPNPPAPTFHKLTAAKPKPTTHPKTPFERLVVDYKQRLAGGMDIDKILKSIYSNAYIALIDAKDAPKVQLPLSMRRAEVALG